MQPVGPYQFIEAISLCPVGSVWSAIDGQGNSYTVAVLDATVAGDQRWRDAFAGTAHGLAQAGAGGPTYVHADFAAAAPWVVYASSDGPGAEQLFAALGMECRPTQSELGGVESVTVKTPIVGAPPGADEDELATPTTRLTPGLAPPGPWQAGPPQPPVTGEPTSGPPHQVSVPPHQISGPPHQVSGPPDQTSAPPHQVSVPPHQVSVPPHQSSGPPYQVSVPPHQISVPPDSISGPPQPLPEMPRPGATGGGSEDPPSSSSYDPLYSPVRHIVPSEPAPSRSRLWIGIAVLVVLVLAGGGTVLALTWSGGEDPSPPAESAPATSQPPAPLPTASALNPGLEPPRQGTWPAQWPKFAATDGVRTLTDLDGLGFTVKVPRDWQCIPGGKADGYAKHYCGVSPGESPEIGGEIVVRNCPSPCGQDQQTAMRRAEEAWGLQWVSTGRYAAYAERSSLNIDGKERYGLIIVAYWRSGSEGVVDRQVVFRMTAPPDGANQLRRIANYIRDTVVF
jgi:hypothetical protein